MVETSRLDPCLTEVRTVGDLRAMLEGLSDQCALSISYGAQDFRVCRLTEYEGNGMPEGEDDSVITVDIELDEDL